NANVKVMEAGVAAAKALNEHWESQWKKMVDLSKTGVVEPQTREETRQKFLAASAGLASADAAGKKAEADRDKAEADLRAARARGDVVRADARRAEAMLGFRSIRAPYDGVVTLRKVSDGDLVQPGGGKDDWLFTVAQMDPVRVVIVVPEADAELVTDGAD